MIEAAGILFVTKGEGPRRVLLLRRTGGDHAGEWCIPGGKLEDGETSEETAVRETDEECGTCPDGDRAELCVTTAPVGITSLGGDAVAVGDDFVRFTTFLQVVDEPFEVDIDPDESTASMWCPLTELPSDLHPGTSVGIRRFEGNETDVARMVAYGELPSPQRFDNMWLFDLRITGTGTAFRDKHEEVVYRPPENYLTPEFLERCAGLAVIINHSVGLMMDEAEYTNKNVGSIRFPYIKGQEVWGVAGIYDSKLAALMQETQLSTSPGVVFKPQNSTNKTVELNGVEILIEGKPGLLDHLAICTAGVWDKGGPPAGVNAGLKQEQEIEMPEALTDAAKLDAILAGLGALTKRMDSLEDIEKSRDAKKDSKWVGRKDGESDEDLKKRREEWEAKKDGESDDECKARKDESPMDEDSEKKGGEEGRVSKEANNESAAGDPKEAKDARKDAEEARKDAAAARKANEELAKRLAAIERGMPKQLSDAELNQFGDVQARADSVLSLLGKQAPRPLHGDDVPTYRRRLANMLTEYSPTWKGIDLNVLKDDTAFAPVENIVYADAATYANNPMEVPEGELREVRTRDVTGRDIVKFLGQPGAWMGEFAAPVRKVTGFDKGGRNG